MFGNASGISERKAKRLSIPFWMFVRVYMWIFKNKGFVVLFRSGGVISSLTLLTVDNV